MALSKAELEKTETALKAAFKAFDNDNGGTGDGFHLEGRDEEHLDATEQ